MSQFPRLLLAAALLVSGLALSGCSGPAEQPLTLVETKSPVQLLRNSAASRVTAGAVSEVQSTRDVSLECGDGDPQRRWFSGVELSITPSWIELVPDITSSLIDSYVADGWTATAASDGRVTLANPESVASIVIAVDGDAPSHIGVEVSGPCVMTDGADSDEVRDLEDVDA